MSLDVDVWMLGCWDVGMWSVQLALTSSSQKTSLMSPTAGDSDDDTSESSVWIPRMLPQQSWKLVQ